VGASVGSSRGRRGGIVGINVTPMVDVMLVLLVIMMVSATYIVSRALKVELPKSASSDESAQGPITVTLTKEHQVLVNQEPVVGDGALIAIFKKARSGPGEPSLVVTGTVIAARCANFGAAPPVRCRPGRTRDEPRRSHAC